MADDRKDNPFFLEAGLDVGQLKKAVTNAEAFYKSFSKHMGHAIEGLESQEKQHEDTGKAAKKAARDQEVSEKKNTEVLRVRFRAIKKVSAGIGTLVEREKSAIQDLGFSWGGLAALIGGVTVAGFIGKSIKDWLELDTIMRDINVTMSDSPRVMRAATGSIQELTGYLGTSREELTGMMKQLGDLRMVRGNTEEAAQAFRQLTMETIHLSKSMDVSTDAVTGLFDTFTRVYNLPHIRLRNIAASMKFIQEQTSISGQELMSFSEGLQDVLSRMIRTTGEGRAAATADLMAMAGVLKDMGVQPEKVSQMFGEAMKLHSEQGAQFLSFITEGTDKSAEQVRKMMQAGDMQTPLTLLINRIKKEGPEYLERNEEWLTEVTGMTFSELRNIQQASSQGLQDLFEQNRKEYIRGQKHAEEAQKRQHRLAKLWNDLKRVAERVWLSIGSVFVNVATKVSEKLVPAIEEMVEKFKVWINSSEGVQAIEMWTGKIISGFMSLGSWLGHKIPAALEVLGKFWDTHLKDKFEWLMTESGGEAVKGWFTDVLDAVKVMAKGIKGIAGVILDVKEALKTDEERMTDYATDQIKTMEKGRSHFETHIARQLKEGGTFKYAGIEMEASPANIESFMNKVQVKQAKDFIKGLDQFKVTTPSEAKAKKAALDRFESALAFQHGQGFGPDFEFMQGFHPAARVMTDTTGGDTKGTGLFAAPELGPRVPPTRVKAPDIAASKAKKEPVQVNVSASTGNQEQLLKNINDSLVKISNKGTQHPSRQLLGAT